MKGIGLSLLFETEDKNSLYFFFNEYVAGRLVHLPPSASSVAVCSLGAFQIHTRDVEEMSNLNTVLQLGVTVSKGSKTQLQVTLMTPKGIVMF